MKNQIIIALAVSFCMLSCGQTEVEKSLFSEKKLTRFLVSHEGPANSAWFNMPSLDSYPRTELGQAERMLDIWRTQSDAIVILELDHTETNDAGSGKFRVAFEGDGSRYFRNSSHWAGWDGGVMIPGEGLYTLQDSTLRFTYERNLLEDYIRDDYSADYKIEYEFTVDNGDLVLKSTDLGISPSEIKSWSKRYNVNLVNPPAVDSLSYTISLSTISHDTLCSECSSLTCNLWWEEMGKPNYHGQRIRRAFNVLKAEAAESEERLDWNELETLLYMVKNEDHRCEQVRLTAASLKTDIGWALATNNPFGREQVGFWENYVLPGYCELQGEGVEDIEDWFTLKAYQVKPHKPDVVNSIALCGQSHFRSISSNPYAGRKDFAICERYFLKAIELGQSWDMDVSRIEEVLNSKRREFEELCASRLFCR